MGITRRKECTCMMCRNCDLCLNELTFKICDNCSMCKSCKECVFCGLSNHERC